MKKSDFLDILNKNSHLIEDYKFEEFYDNIDNDDFKPLFTRLFIDCGVNPLLYMNKVPIWYAYGLGIEEVFIPKNIRYISNYAFAHCYQLKKVTFEQDSNLLNINNNSFKNCTSIESIDLPQSLINIGYGAFENCIHLKEVFFKDNLAFVDSRCFYETDLQDVFYSKSENDWNNIDISDAYNSQLLDAEKHFNYKE